MANYFVGELRLFGGNFAPKNWALCNGQFLPVQQNQALFSLLGTTYGGNGVTTFALPNLQGRVAIGQGTGAGLTPRAMGELDGTSAVTLTSLNLPLHTHTVKASADTVTAASTTPSTSTVLAPTARSQAAVYSAGTANTAMAPGAVTVAGSSQPISTYAPSLGLTYIIALVGIFPSRN